MNKFHNFDNWNRYLDNAGNILHGKFLFALKDTMEPVNIADKDGTLIDNPILTDIKGRTNIQVFIPDNIEVTVFVYKYIGNGIMVKEITNNEELWELQYTINVNNPVEEIDVKDATRCPNINALKDAATDFEYITLIGYNNAYDTEPVNYFWDPNSIEDPDDATVIKSNKSNVGRWKLVRPCNYMCSTHFGIFPFNTINNNEDQTVRIQKFIAYCNKVGLKPLFEADSNYRYYTLKDITLISNNDIFVNEYTQFICTGTVDIHADFYGSTTQLFHRNIGDRVLVTCKEGYTAWGCELSCKNAVHFNGQYIYPTLWEGITCYIEDDISGQVFNNVNIIAAKVIKSENAWQNMSVKEIWFTDDADYQNIEETCILDLNEWPSTDKWIYYKNQIDNGNYGDMHGRNFSADIVQEHSVTISNFISSGNITAPYVNISDAQISGNVISDNMNLNNAVISSYINPEYITAVNSNLNNINVKNTGNITNCVCVNITGEDNATVNISNSTITGLINVNTSVVRGSHVNDISGHTVTVNNSIVSGNISGTILYAACNSVVKQIIVRGMEETICNIVNNDAAKLYITGAALNCKFNGIITGNNFTEGFKIDHAWFISDDRQHSYTFKNNVVPVHTQSIRIEWDNSHKDGTWKPSANTMPIYFDKRDDAVFGHCVEGYMYMHYLTAIPVDLFAIGTTYIKPRKFRMRYKETSKFAWNYVFGGVKGEIGASLAIHALQNPIYTTDIQTTDREMTYNDTVYTGNVGYSDDIGYYYLPIHYADTNGTSGIRTVMGLDVINIGEQQANAMYTYATDPTHYTLDYDVEILD